MIRPTAIIGDSRMARKFRGPKPPKPAHTLSTSQIVMPKRSLLVGSNPQAHNVMIAHDGVSSDMEKVDLWWIMGQIEKSVIPEPLPKIAPASVGGQLYHFTKKNGWYSRPEDLYGLVGPNERLMALYTWGTGEFLINEYCGMFQPQLVPYMMNHFDDVIAMILGEVSLDAYLRTRLATSGSNMK